MVSSSYAGFACLGLADCRPYSRTGPPSGTGTKGETGLGVENGVGLHAWCKDLASDNKQPSVFAIYAVCRIGSKIQICASICVPLGGRPFLVLDRKHARQTSKTGLGTRFGESQERGAFDPGSRAALLRDSVWNWSSWLFYWRAACNHTHLRCTVVVSPRSLFRQGANATANGTRRDSLI